ncbi:MAG TPA: lipopolysaccharide kinase InaA family protein [Pirellulales bacterium]|jgi:hypothetical protein
MSLMMQKTWRRVGSFDESLPTSLIDALWPDPTTVLEGGEVLRQSASRRTAQFRWDDGRYVIKHYREASLRHAAKRGIQRSRASGTWENARRIAEAGILTPQPVALVERRLGPLRGASWFVYRYIEGETLGDCLAPRRTVATARLEQLGAMFAQLWRRLVAQQISLDDAHLGNFIVSPTGQLWLIDIDKIRFHRFRAAANRRSRLAWEQLVGSVVFSGTNAERFLREVIHRLELAEVAAAKRMVRARRVALDG